MRVLGHDCLDLYQRVNAIATSTHRAAAVALTTTLAERASSFNAMSWKLVFEPKLETYAEAAQGCNPIPARQCLGYRNSRQHQDHHEAEGVILSLLLLAVACGRHGYWGQPEPGIVPGSYTHCAAQVSVAAALYVVQA